MNNVVVQIKFGVGQKCFQFESAQDLRGSFSWCVVESWVWEKLASVLLSFRVERVGS